MNISQKCQSWRGIILKRASGNILKENISFSCDDRIISSDYFLMDSSEPPLVPLKEWDNEGTVDFVFQIFLLVG